MAITGLLDDAYALLHDKGPEFEGWLSNHGPMAADALMRLDRSSDMPRWVRGYAKRLEPMPGTRWQISEAEWREVLGDASRLGDWCALLTRQVRTEPWDAVLARWWPRLLPGAVAAAAHGLIRTGHAVRALKDHVTEPRLDELGHALGYWAARWQGVPRKLANQGSADVGDALEALPARELNGGIRTRLAYLDDDEAWPRALASVAPLIDSAAVPGALDTLVDAAVSCYGRWAHTNPVMLVHAATAPRAVALALPALPEHLWLASYETAWTLSATIATLYRPARPAPCNDETLPTLDEVVEHAIASGDEHAIKFTEVAVESHRRGNTGALACAERAAALISAR